MTYTCYILCICGDAKFEHAADYTAFLKTM